MIHFLQLRHRMGPYLYTMNYRAWALDEPLCQPLYYKYPTKWEAYSRKNQYLFGSELMVAPITTKRIEKLNAAEVMVWLPEGMWFDFFTDTLYTGNRSLCMYRGIDQIPVLAKAGAIIPLTDDIIGTHADQNPEALTVEVYPGADNRFLLYEDDNETNAYLDGIYAQTELHLNWTERKFFIEPVNQNSYLIPEERYWKIRLHKVTADTAEVRINGNTAPAKVEKDGSTLVICLEHIHPEDLVEITLPGDTEIAGNQAAESLYAFLNQAEIRFFLKDQIYDLVMKHGKNIAAIMGEMQVLGADEILQRAVMEIIGADGRE